MLPLFSLLRWLHYAERLAAISVAMDIYAYYYCR